MTDTPEEPYVMGGGLARDPAPMPTKEDGWMAAYVARMVECGVDAEDAWACCRAGSHDFSDDPRDSADDEMSYWDTDTDGVLA